MHQPTSSGSCCWTTPKADEGRTTTWLTSAFRSRVLIAEVRRPTQSELRGAVEYVVRDLEREWGVSGTAQPRTVWAPAVQP